MNDREVMIKALSKLGYHEMPVGHNLKIDTYKITSVGSLMFKSNSSIVMTMLFDNDGNYTGINKHL